MSLDLFEDRLDIAEVDIAYVRGAVSDFESELPAMAYRIEELEVENIRLSERIAALESFLKTLIGDTK